MKIWNVLNKVGFVYIYPWIFILFIEKHEEKEEEDQEEMHNVNNKKQKLISKEQDETSVQQYIIATFKTPENMKVVKKKRKTCWHPLVFLKAWLHINLL
jgi:hypothetical protein